MLAPAGRNGNSLHGNSACVIVPRIRSAQQDSQLVRIRGISPASFSHPSLYLPVYSSASFANMFLKLVLWLFFHTLAAATDCPSGYTLDTGPIPENQKVEWGLCDENYSDEPNIECGSIRVPLDYTNASPGVLTLRLARLRADPSVSNGKSIVTNPGGPGIGGLSRLIQGDLE